MPQKLDPYQRRVLGVLLEKALAQPQYYPMTLNAVTASCNQKNNRDPELNLAEESVYDTLEILRGMGLVIRASTSGGRTDRFKHLAQEVYGWDGRQRAIMAELLLRGPQTLSELKTRCARMATFETIDDVTATLESLRDKPEPHVAVLPRQPGQAVIRWTHLLYPDGEAPPAGKADGAGELAPQPARSTAAMPHTPGNAMAAAAPPASELAVLRGEFEAMQSEIADLHEVLAELRRRVETLEQR